MISDAQGKKAVFLKVGYRKKKGETSMSGHSVPRLDRKGATTWEEERPVRSGKQQLGKTQFPLQCAKMDRSGSRRNSQGRTSSTRSPKGKHLREDRKGMPQREIIVKDLET